jgi:hypothetical protein
LRLRPAATRIRLRRRHTAIIVALSSLPAKLSLLILSSCISAGTRLGKG